MALITLDYVAKRYGTLPSVILRDGSSLDVQIANVAAEYEAHLHRTAKDQAENPNKVNLDRSLSTEQMQAMLNSVRGQ